MRTVAGHQPHGSFSLGLEYTLEQGKKCQCTVEKKRAMTQMCDDFSCFCHHIQETTDHIQMCTSGEISVQPPRLQEDQTDNLI